VDAPALRGGGLEGEDCYWNAGEVEARYLFVMSPRTAALVAELHAGTGESYAEIFRRHASELLA
jgi:hypothetical protein